ncbi:MAG TPA: RNA-binding protein [Stellaceae bacterium]|nr:RNA-binding protein [Stellaceae bacterium]
MAAALQRDEETESGPLRRCLVSGESRAKAELLRFVVAPDGRLVADVAARLPGRGLWLTARRDILATAVTKRLFARAARQAVIIEDDLADRVEALLAERCRDHIGLARRAGQAVMGFVKVQAALTAGKAGVLVAAADGAAGGRDKLWAVAKLRDLPLVECLTGVELGAAFGREHAVHAALTAGRLGEMLVADAARLAGFRPRAADQWMGAVVAAAAEKSDGTE